MTSGCRIRESDNRVSRMEHQVKSDARVGVLIPGYAQWRWGQKQRASVLFGAFVLALGVGTLWWGTLIGLAFVAIAFCTHVVSTVNLLKQYAFPGFGRVMSIFSATTGLGVGVYAPVLYVVTLVAWPATDLASGQGGYLVDFSAYRGHEPRDGDWVWLRKSPWGDSQIGRVVARAGQEVDWSANRLLVDGRDVEPKLSLQRFSAPTELAFLIPSGHLLLAPGITTSSDRELGQLMLVSRDDIVGRAWARMYPLWVRRGLH